MTLLVAVNGSKKADTLAVSVVATFSFLGCLSVHYAEKNEKKKSPCIVLTFTLTQTIAIYTCFDLFGIIHKSS